MACRTGRAVKGCVWRVKICLAEDFLEKYQKSCVIEKNYFVDVQLSIDRHARLAVQTVLRVYRDGTSVVYLLY